VVGQEALERLGGRPAAAPEAVGEGGQHPALRGGLARVVDQPLGSQGGSLGLVIRRIEDRPGLGAGGQLRHARRVDVQLVPEQAAGWRIGTGLERGVQESGQERQGADDRAAALAHPADQRLQVGEIAAAGAALSLQGVHGAEQAPAPPVGRVGEARGADDVALAAQARLLDDQAVVACGQARRQSELLHHVARAVDLARPLPRQLVRGDGPGARLPALELELAGQRRVGAGRRPTQAQRRGGAVPGQGHRWQAPLPQRAAAGAQRGRDVGQALQRRAERLEHAQQHGRIGDPALALDVPVGGVDAVQTGEPVQRAAGLVGRGSRGGGRKTSDGSGCA
jgi:hypothetical protein